MLKEPPPSTLLHNHPKPKRPAFLDGQFGKRSSSSKKEQQQQRQSTPARPERKGRHERPEPMVRVVVYAEEGNRVRDALIDAGLATRDPVPSQRQPGSSGVTDQQSQPPQQQQQQQQQQEQEPAREQEQEQLEAARMQDSEVVVEGSGPRMTCDECVASGRVCDHCAAFAEQYRDYL